MAMSPAIDITAEQRKTVLSLLSGHLPDTEAWVYGSRVRWTSRPESDLDLVVFASPEQARGVSDLREAFEESNLPFRVDLFVWDEVPESFRERIEQEHVVVLEKGNARTEPKGSIKPDRNETALGDLIDIVHGFAFKGKFIHDEPRGDVLLTPGNFAIGGGFKADKFKYYSGIVPDDFVLSEGDLIVSMADLSKLSDTLGYPAFVPECKGSRRYLHNQRLGKVTLQGTEVERKYIYYVMCGKDYRHEVLASATGTAVKHTSPDRIKQFRFQLPSLSEQRAIAHILGTLDDKIELNRRMNETLEAMARAIFKDWFVDFGPVRTKMEGSDPYFSAEIWGLFPEVMDDEGKPVGWAFSEIGKEVQAVGGGTPSTKEPTYWDGGEHHWATPKDLSKLNSPVLLGTDRKITDAGVNKISSGILPIGTVLLSSRAPIGYLAIAEVPTAVNQGFIAMVCQKRLPNTFVLFWCHENLDYIKDISSGSTFAEISKKTFRPVPVLVPSEEILGAYDRLIRPLYGRIVANTKENETLAQTRDLLLPKLMSGEIRLREAEKAVEATA